MGHQGAGHHGRGRGWSGPPGPGGPWQQHRGSGPPWAGLAGPPPWLAGLFGVGQTEERRGPRVRRGDVRSAILDVLAAASGADEAINGYQVIQQIAERSQEEWRPSPGSVYPTIQQLLDEGLVENDEEHGRRTVRLTAAGHAYVEDHAAELAAVWAPFERGPRAEPTTGRAGSKTEIKSEIGQVMSAIWQISTAGSEQQRRAAIGILVDTRRRLYGVLADGQDGDPGESHSGEREQ